MLLQPAINGLFKPFPRWPTEPEHQERPEADCRWLEGSISHPPLGGHGPEGLAAIVFTSSHHSTGLDLGAGHSLSDPWFPRL